MSTDSTAVNVEDQVPVTASAQGNYSGTQSTADTAAGETRTANRKVKQKNFVVTMLTTIVTRGVAAAGAFLLSLQLARQLPLEDFGRFSFGLTLLVALTIIARFGCDFSLLQVSGAAWHKGDIARFGAACRYALGLTFKLSALMMLSLVPVLVIIGLTSDYRVDTVAIMLMGLIPATLMYVVSAGFKSAQRPQIGAMLEMGTVSLLCGAAFFVARLMGGPQTAEFAAAMIVLASVSLCSIGYLSLRRIWGYASSTFETQQLDTQEFRRMSRDFTVIANAQVLGNWGGLFLLGILKDASEVGLYTAAIRTALIPSLLVNIVVSVCSPRLAGLYESDKHQDFRRLAQTSATAIFLFNFPILVATACFSPLLMSMFGKQFTEQTSLLTIIAVGLMIQSATALSSAILGMAKYQALVRRITVATAILSTLLSALLIYWMGALGAAIGFAIYSSSHPVVMSLAVKRELGFWPVPVNPVTILKSSRRKKPATPDNFVKNS